MAQYEFEAFELLLILKRMHFKFQISIGTLQPVDEIKSCPKIVDRFYKDLFLFLLTGETT